MTQNTWPYQGRQQHGEWGHGTAPHADKPTTARPDAPASDSVEDRASYAAHDVVGQLPLSRAGLYASRLHYGMLGNFQKVAAAHRATALLDDATYRSKIVDDKLSLAETGYLRRAAAVTHDARTLNALAPATDALAALLKSAGLPIMDKGIAAAAANAAVYRPANTSVPVILAFAGPSTATRLAERLLELGVRPAVLEFAGRVALAAAALAMTGILSPHFDPRFTADPVRGHPEARAVVDWSKRRVAISVPDPAGGPPGTIGLAMVDHYENGQLTEVLRDRNGIELGIRGAHGTITLNPLGEQALAEALANRPQGDAGIPAVGSIFVTRSQKQRFMVATMQSLGKSDREIQAALDDDNAATDPRNAGLPPELRTDSGRSRKAAVAGDPALRAALDSGRVLDEDYVAHHLIPMQAVRAYRDLFEAAARAGWRPDAAGNIIALPSNADEAQPRMEREMGEKRGVHDNGHPNWNNDAMAEIREIRDRLLGELLLPSGPAYDQAARKALDELQERLRRIVPKDRVTMLDIPKGTV